MPAMANDKKTFPVIDPACFPDTSLDAVDFRDTSFFQTKEASTSLSPTPLAIIEENPRVEKDVLIFKDQHLAVKIGPSTMVKFEEALAMRAIKKAFPKNEIPVPEVFGWRKHGRLNFIYMSYVPGITLREAWPDFKEQDKQRVCKELHEVVSALRRLKQPKKPPFIGICLPSILPSFSCVCVEILPGSVNKGPMTDRFFRYDYEEGPLHSIDAFNDLLVAAATRQPYGPQEIIKPPQHDEIPNDGEVYFTHGDLTLNNVLITGSTGSYKVEGIIDWEQAGWYPEYWEYCKMLYAIEIKHEFREAGWAQTIMRPWEDAFETWAEYSLWRMP
ncbi:hypothetical protein S40288_04955 [Stachybotrys chartarum IBT 40288]|nr:hypothetical protein S40288_04955 [Stachybotrys chartarum IBT 40288]